MSPAATLEWLCANPTGSGVQPGLVMQEKFLRFSIGVSEFRTRQLDAIAIAQASTRAAIIREAIATYCDDKNGASLNHQRIAMLSEYTQVALDMMVRNQFPDRRQDILQMVEDRMERYHVAR